MKIAKHNYNFRPYRTGTISVCMIAKNEEHRLSRCVNSLEGLADEIILVDTGSEDNTCKLAKSLGIKVYHQDWDDDFSKPRNYGISKATKDWILIVDPDETINKKDHFYIKQLTSQFNYLAFQITTRNYGRSPGEQGFFPCRGQYPEEKGYPGYVLSNKTRLFKNGLGIIFIGCYHELADWYIIKHRIPCATVKIPVHHWSHEISQSNIKEKRRFYLRLAEKKVRENPEDDQAWWELGVTESIAGLRHRAVRSVGMSLRKGYTDHKRLFTLASLYKYIKNPKKSTLAFEKGICKLYPTLTHIQPYDKTYDKLIPITTT